MVLFGYFWTEIRKKKLSYLKSAPLNLSKCKVSCKRKKLGVWDHESLILVLLGQNWKNCCHIWNRHFGVCKSLKFHVKEKQFILRPNFPYLELFWTGIWKNYCYICNQHPQICQNAKFHVKRTWSVKPKMP